MNRHIIKSALFAALSLMIAACSERIEFETGEGCPLSFDPTIYNPSADIETRGSMCNTPSDLYDIGSFNVSATNSDGSTFVGATTVSFTGNEWVMPGTAPLWKASEVKTFFASANTSSTGANVGVSSGKHTLTYTVPATASDQKDILLGYYKGNGDGKGRASIRFHHPLTAVKLQLAEDCEYTVTGIEISGVYASGTDEVTYTDGVPSNSWGSLLSGGTVSTTDIGETFILIPQTVAADAVDVTITAEGETLPFKGSIPAGEWKPGKTNTYTVSLKEGLIDFSINRAVAQSYIDNSDDNIFSTALDPTYWVDLGMVSENGYPLYISRYPLKSATQYETEAKSASWNWGGKMPADINVSPDGYPCRPISIMDAMSLLFNDSVEKIYDTQDITLSSKGESVIFYGGQIATSSSAYTNYDNGFAIKDGCISYGSADKNLHLVYEDIFAEQIKVKSLNLYVADLSFVAYGNNYIGYPFPETLHRIDNSVVKNIPSEFDFPFASRAIEFSFDIVFENDYHLFGLSDGLVLGFQNSRYNSYDLTARYENFNDDVTFMVRESLRASGCNSLKFTIFLECFVKGTLITLADGSKKPVESITYGDEILVWNFDKGCYDSAKILWLTRNGLHNDHYIRCTFSDGTVLKVTGQNSHHKIYNCTDRFFEGVTKMEPGTEVFTENGVVTLVSKEWIDEEVEYYNLITDRHINCFAEGVLTSARYNNSYPIDEDMKFVKDGRKIRPYREFKPYGISREWYNGLRLGEQLDSLESIRKYIDKVESQMEVKPDTTLWQRIRTWWRSVFHR